MKASDKTKLWTTLSVCGLLVGVDRLTKALAHSYLSDDSGDGAVRVIKGFLYLRWNTNSAGFFGFLDHLPQDTQPVVFAIGTVLFAGLLLYWIRSAAPEHLDEVSALALILGGALGNGYDRVVHGYVIDCIFVVLFDSMAQRAAFNIADLAIAVGMVWLIRIWIGRSWQQRKAKRAAP